MANTMFNDLEENQVTFEGKKDELDENGEKTGEKIITYSNPVMARARIGPNMGNAADSPFGRDIVYDKSISTVKRLPINEYSRLFIDVVPVIKEDGTTDTEPDYVCVCPQLGLVQNVWAIKKIAGAEI